MSTHNKHIVFVPENKDWGGSELLWSKTALWLAKQDAKVTVVKHEALKFPSWFSDENSSVKIVNARTSKLNLLKKICNRFLPYSARFKEKNNRLALVIAEHPSLVVINQGFNFNGAQLAQDLNNKNIPYVMLSHAVNEGLWPNKQLRALMKYGFLNSQKNYFVSHDNFEVTQLQIGHKLINAEIVRNPYNVAFNNSGMEVISDTFNLAVVGRYHFSSKGQDVIFRVLKDTKWRERDLIVNFYGSGEDIDNLKDIISNFNLSNARIHEYTETSKIWEQNHGLLLTSRYEGMPITIIEAMLSKRFVITTNVSGNTELLTDNKNAFIAEAPRPLYVDKALERAWKRKEEWKAIGEQACQDITKHIPEHPEKVFGEKLLELLN